MRATTKALSRLSAFFVYACLTLTCQAQRELVLVSPHWEGIQYEFTQAFTAHYKQATGETVVLRWRDLGGTSQIEKALDALYKSNPDSSGIDVFFGGGIDPFESQKAKGHLEAFRLPEPILKTIPPEVGGFPIVDPDFMFYGAALSSFGVLENVRIVDTLKLPPVKTWEDLTDPRLQTWVSATDPRKSGAAHMIYEIILQAYGWDKGWQVIYETSGNVRAFEQASSGPAKQVSAGDAAYALVIDINGMTQQAFLGGDNVRFTIPEGLSVINPDGIAILKGAPNEDVAKAFIEFVMSDAGQRLWMTPTGQPGGPVKFGISRMGIRPDFYPSDLSGLLVPLNPFTTTHAVYYNSRLGSQRWAVVNALMGQSIIDIHSHLTATWSAITALPLDQQAPLLAEFGKPLVTEAEAAQLSASWSKDKLRSGQLANEWMARAVDRFHSLREKALHLQQP